LQKKQKLGFQDGGHSDYLLIKKLKQSFYKALFFVVYFLEIVEEG